MVAIMERRAQAAESLLAASTDQDALGHAIRAAELYMRAAGEASDKTHASQLRRKCQDLIAYAERVKAQLATAPSAVPATETSILRCTSRLHGNDFPLWEAAPSNAEFELQPGSEPFTWVALAMPYG